MNRAAQSLGRLGGRAKSPAKEASSKVNGIKGGRPRTIGAKTPGNLPVNSMQDRLIRLPKEMAKKSDSCTAGTHRKQSSPAAIQTVPSAIFPPAK